MDDHRVRGFGFSLLAAGAACGTGALLLASGRFQDPFGGPRPFWGVLAVVGALYLLLGLRCVTLKDADGSGGGVYLGIALFHTTGVTVGAATAQLTLFTLHEAGLLLRLDPRMLQLTANPLVYGALTTIAGFFALLALLAYVWSGGRGSSGRKSLAARKHVFAVALLLVPWLLPFGFMA